MVIRSALWRRGLLASALMVLIIVMALAVACQSYGSNPPPATSPTSGTNSVKMVNLSFDPANITVKVGTTVTWTNLEAVEHTVTSDTGAFNSGTMSRNATFSFTFTNRGTFSYSCGFHPTMKGRVVVE